MTTQTEALKMALEAAYLAGFNASGEGYNGEYPFGDKMQDPAENRVWKKNRDNYIKEALAQQSNEQLDEHDWNDEQLKMLNFLYGSSDFDGVWFEQRHPTERAAFWWRKHLKRLFTHPPVPTAQPKEPEQEPVAWKDLTNSEMMALCRDIESRKHSAYDILWEASTRLKARNATPPQRKPLEPVEGDLLPAIGSKVLIHLARQDEWVERTVVGYYVWGSLDGRDERMHRVFVRVVDADGIQNARMLRDVRQVEAAHGIKGEA